MSNFHITQIPLFLTEKSMMVNYNGRIEKHICTYIHCNTYLEKLLRGTLAVKKLYSKLTLCKEQRLTRNEQADIHVLISRIQSLKVTTVI